MTRSSTRIRRLRGALALVAAIGTGACATRRPESIAPVAPVANTLIWRLEAGDLIKSTVFRNPDLNTETAVGLDGTAYFPGLGRITVRGLSPDSLEVLLNGRYATSVLKDAAVHVTMQRDITLYGQVRFPGVYPSDPSLTLLGLIAKAGGPNNTSNSITAEIQKVDGTRLSLARQARLGAIELHSGDAIYLSDESFFVRNSTSIQATGFVVNMVSALIGIILLVTR